MNESKVPLTEREAILGDKHAVLEIVSALRKYRAASKLLLSKRWPDGECDMIALIRFENTIEEIEEKLAEQNN